MKQLDLGKHGEHWTPEYVRLLREAVRNLFLMYRPVDLVLKEFKKYYQTERSDNSLWWQIKKYFEENKLLFDRWVDKGRVHWMIREFSEIPDGCAIPKTQRIGEKSDKTVSEIFLSEKGDTLFYIYPTVPDADYAKMFLRIFQKKNVEGTFGDESKDFYEFEKGKKVRIPLRRPNDSDTSYKQLITSVWYCLDLLFAGLVSELEEDSGESINLDSLCDKVKCIIRILASRGYFFSEEERLTDLLSRPKRKVAEKNFIGKINEIKISKDEDYIEIPAYKIQMSRFFELYVYCVLSEANPDLDFVYKKKYKSDKSTRIPDMTVGKDCIVDAKYKFQYGDDGYCDIKDASRMSRYLADLAKKEGNAPYGIFCFPKGDEQEDFVIEGPNSKEGMIRKKGISFPIKKRRQ